MSDFKNWADNLVEGKNPCRKCRSKGNDRSGDNFHYYGEGQGGHCHSCGYTLPSDEWLEENGKTKGKYYREEAKEEKFDIFNLKEDFDISDWQVMKEKFTPNPFGYRGITDEDLCISLGILHEYSPNTGEIVNQYCPMTKKGEFVGCKFRVVADKKFFFMGETGNSLDLFGQFLYQNSNSKKVLITAGEIDALSGSQMLSKGRNKDFEPIPVVSPTNGEGGAYKQLQEHYEWFDSFEEIIICFDNDEAGKLAIEKAAKVLPSGKVHVMKLTMKDTNEYLEAGREKEWVNCFWKAVKYVPAGIVGSGSLMEKIGEYIKIPKIPLPPFMHELQTLMAGGVPLGVIVTLGSASGSGKSTIVDECSYYWYFNSPHKIGVVTLEADSAMYGINILSRHLKRKINLIESIEEKEAYLLDPEVVEAANKLWYDEDGNERFFLVEDRGGSLEEIKDLVSNLIISCGCKVIVLDPISDVLEGSTREEQEMFCKWMKGMVKSHLVSFVNIAHVRKSSGGQKANSTGAELHEEDFFGSSSIFKSSACNLLFMRNKEAENSIDRNTTRMKASKIRWTGRTSPYAGEYYYDNVTHTMFDKKEWVKDNEVPEGKFSMKQEVKKV